MTPAERLAALLAEELPTGEWGGPRPDAPPATSPALAALHRAELAAEIAAYDAAHGAPCARPVRRLRPVPGQARPAPAQQHEEVA